MRFKRIFHPVGHGAFFTEQIFDGDKCLFTAVYDCGADNQKDIDNAITAFFNDGNEIDALFISHFDEDHVNGMPKLASHFKKNVKVFIPFYHINLLNIYPRHVKNAISLILIVLQQNNTTPTMVIAGNPDNATYDIDELPRETTEIISGTRLHKRVAGHEIWEYVPFNLYDEPKLADLQLLVPTISLDRPKDWSPEQIKEVRRVYHDNATKSVNENSLIMLSHPLVPVDCYDTELFCLATDKCYIYHCKTHCHSLNCCFVQTCYCYESDLASCLYTGDSVLKKSSSLEAKNMKKYDRFLFLLMSYVHKIGVFQIPHHGSKSNTNLATLIDSVSNALFVNCSQNDLATNILHYNSVYNRVFKPIAIVDEQNALTQIIHL